ncbi:MAG: hypothetical protein ACRD2L_18420, partial [Terriglobia bacterium]
MTIGLKPSEIRDNRRLVSGLKTLAFSLFILAVSSARASSVDSLTEFEPSGQTSAHGKVSQVQFATNLIDLKADSLVQAPEGAVKHFRFGERVWVIGFQTQIFDPSGEPSRENYLCHTFISNQTPDERPLGHSAHGHQMSAIYS